MAGPTPLFAARAKRPSAAGDKISLSGGSGSGGGGGGGGAPAGASIMGSPARDDKEADDAYTVATNVRQVGNNFVLYRRGPVWVMPATAKLDAQKDKDKITEIKRFTKEYFDLVKANTREENEVLSTQQEGEKLLVEFRGKAYSISD